MVNKHIGSEDTLSEKDCNKALRKMKFAQALMNKVFEDIVVVRNYEALVKLDNKFVSQEWAEEEVSQLYKFLCKTKEDYISFTVILSK
jgi:uncharacterized protein YqgQ